MTSKNQKGKRAIPKLKNNKDARRLEKIKPPRKRKPILLKNNLFKKKALKKPPLRKPRPKQPKRRRKPRRRNQQRKIRTIRKAVKNRRIEICMLNLLSKL